MANLAYNIGDKLISRRVNDKGKNIHITVLKIDANAHDGLVYYTHDSEGTHKWWHPKELERECRTAQPKTDPET